MLLGATNIRHESPFAMEHVNTSTSASSWFAFTSPNPVLKWRWHGVQGPSKTDYDRIPVLVVKYDISPWAAIFYFKGAVLAFLIAVLVAAFCLGLKLHRLDIFRVKRVYVLTSLLRCSVQLRGIKPCINADIV